MKSVIKTVGDTPFIEVYTGRKTGGRVFVKCENRNPGCSIKDRIAKQMIIDAIANGQIDPEHPEDCLIIEATSGNTAIGLAFVCKAYGFPLAIFMPENMTEERKTLIRAYGARLILTPSTLGMRGSVDAAEELYKETIKTGKKAFKTMQFDNPSNPKAHYTTTGPEIAKEYEKMVLPGQKPEFTFVAGFGTGGTVSGTGHYLKDHFGSENVKVIALEPSESPLVSKGIAGPHKISGIGPNFVPKNLDKRYIDEFRLVTSQDALDTAKKLAKEEALLVGVSSGCNIFMALKIAEETGKDVVTVLCDSGERYFSTGLFN